jgi:hypothetical protein
MAETKRPRRYYLHKRQTAREMGDEALALVWRGKQEAELGTPLPPKFPSAAVLSAGGYTTTEDLDGADCDELLELGLNRAQAEGVLTALSELL